MTEELKSAPVLTPLISPERDGPIMIELAEVINRHRETLPYQDLLSLVGSLAGVTVASAPCRCEHCVILGIARVVNSMSELLFVNKLLVEDEASCNPERIH